MSGISFLFENYALEADLSLTTGAENAQFPLLNLKNVSTVKKFRSVGNTVVIEFDLMQTRDIGAIAVAGDAAGLFGLSAASVKTSVTNDFSLATPIALDISAEQNMGYKVINEVSHRYVELTLTGTGSFCEVGSVYIGSAMTLELNNLSLNSFQYGYVDRSEARTNRYGTKFINKLPLRKTLGGAIEYCNKTEQELLDNMFIYLGLTNPFWVIVDLNSEGMNDGKYKLTMYSYLAALPDWSANGGRHYSTDLQMEQVI